MSIKLLLSMSVCFLFLNSCDSTAVTVNPDSFYAPEVFSDAKYFSITIPVEIEEKNGKKSFVKLFEVYGFSGNGPSIEQVVKKNIGISGLNYDSEGDAFVILAENAEQHKEVLKKLKCVENIACLNGWLKNSTSIILKE